MIRAIIFDMDGLMIDSERVTFESYQEVLKDMNLTMDRTFYVSLLGRTKEGIAKQFYDAYGHDFPFDQVITKCHEVMAKRFEQEGVPLKPGLLHLLSYLKKEHHYKTIVATSSTRDRVDKILKQAHITDYFDDSICGDEVTKGKPNPEVFLKSCEKLGVKSDEAYILEDSESGIMAAYSANIKVICVPDMKYPEAQYASKCYKIVETLDDVIDILER